ncbi:MAG: hypothetical protein R3275_01850 [Saprospiraceae bacterium]|nr:hypothetical protein [Saprospiraceae bacterium]
MADSTNLAGLIQNSLLFALLFAGTVSFGQINLLVGYGLGYQPSSDLNQMIEDHNNDTEWYKDEFNELRLTHGLYLGIRYNWGPLKSVVSYRNSGVRMSAEGIPPQQSDAFRRKLFFRNNVLSIGVESNYETVDWGISLDQNFYRISAETSDLSDSYSIQKPSFFSGHLYLNINLKGYNNLGFTIQPYVQYPFTMPDLEALSEELDLTERRYDLDITTFGITLLLVNGPQD